MQAISELNDVSKHGAGNFCVKYSAQMMFFNHLINFIKFI